ncbi:MAG TPA: family 1 glycosylhydrolase [Acidimicrobiales bacterium]|nr:family 1 glycosylhydrolase [Acidimicrobiales bacterium]
MPDTPIPPVFPPDFLVGASTAAHQVEGGNVNSTWWAYEHAPGTPLKEPSGDAADSYHRWEEDLDLVADLGLDAYRFSIEWARVEPEPGLISRAALQHYGRMIDGCRHRGIEPVVTLHHFTEPRWFGNAGGWVAAGAATRFAAYVAALRPILEPVRWAVTINEPNMVAIMARIVRLFATPTRRDGASDSDASPHDPGRPLPIPEPATRDALTAAHRAARDVLHDNHPGMRVGWSVANQVIQSVPGGEAAADAYRDSREDVYLRVSRDDDFVGVQAYTRTVLGPDGPVRDDPEDGRTLMGWEYYPEALAEAVRHTRAIVGEVPILVTENGIATAADDRRIAYTAAALDGLQAAIADGADVRGYLHWSLLDNYEWGSYRPTFGLVAWDPETFDRTPKPSARWLGEIARRRAEH